MYYKKEYEKIINTLTFQEFLDNDTLCGAIGLEIIEKNISFKGTILDDCIILSKTLNFLQKRETIMHEIPHHFLHQFNYSETSNYEMEANRNMPYFAIPTKFLIDDLLALDGEIDIAEISEKYSVKEKLMIARIERLFHNIKYYVKHDKTVNSIKQIPKEKLLLCANL